MPAPGTKSSAYTMNNVMVILDQRIVIGFWDGDDAVQIEPLLDVGTMMIGADGSSIFSQHANEGATITLRLQHTSPTHRLLMQKLARQRTRGMLVEGFDLTIMDIDSQEGGTTDQAFIQKAPTDQKGVEAAVREWVLVTGFWVPDIPVVEPGVLTQGVNPFV